MASESVLWDIITQFMIKHAGGFMSLADGSYTVCGCVPCERSRTLFGSDPLQIYKTTLAGAEYRPKKKSRVRAE